MRAFFIGAALLSISTVVASCSEGADDSLVRACRVVVETCHRGPSVGQCLDDLDSLTQDCVDCIGTHECDYTKCQAEVAGCRIPPWLLDAKDRIDAGPTPPDAAVDATSTPPDAASTSDARDSGNKG